MVNANALTRTGVTIVLFVIAPVQVRRWGLALAMACAQLPTGLAFATLVSAARDATLQHAPPTVMERMVNARMASADVLRAGLVRTAPSLIAPVVALAMGCVSTKKLRVARQHSVACAPRAGLAVTAVCRRPASTFQTMECAWGAESARTESACAVLATMETAVKRSRARR